MRVRRAGLWRNADFLKLWAGESISVFGSQLTTLALPLLAAVTLGASPGAMGLLAAASTAPILLLGLPAGVWVDRRRRRPLLLAADSGRAVLLAAIPLAALLGRLDLPLLYGVAFLAGALTVVFDVAYQAYLPALVTRAHLVEGNGKLEVSRSLAQVAGPAAAGALVALLTAPLTIALDALSFVASAACLALIRRPEAAPATARQRRNLGREIAEGLRFVAGHRLLRTLVGVNALGNLCGGALFAQQILFMVRTLGLPPAGIGAILAVAGPSGLLGALVVAPATRRLGVGRTLLAGTVLFTAGDFALAFAGGSRLSTVALLVLAQALIGVGSPLYNITAISLRQALTPDRLLGRVTASARLVSVGTLPLGALLGGALSERFGVRATLVVAAVGMLLPLVWLVRSPVGALREPPAAGSSVSGGRARHLDKGG